jgi:hypothetical protein
LGSESVAPRTHNPDADDLYRSVASLHVLAPRHRKSAVDKASDHVAIEPMGEYEEFLSGALRIAGEQLQRLALLGSQPWPGRGGCHHFFRFTSP